jgi:hypothetical protein
MMRQPIWCGGGPQSGDAHFALSYVLRYAGMQEQAMQRMQYGAVARPGQF